MAQSYANRPLVYLRDVKFESCTGKNVLCLSPSVDLQRTYATWFNRSDNVKAFMAASSKFETFTTYKKFNTPVAIF